MPGKSLGLTIPTRISHPVINDYLDALDTVLDAFVADIEPLITPDEINVNATFDFNEQDADNISKAIFTALSGLPTSGSQAIFWYAGELYARDNAGNNVQLTSGGALNAAAVGGIGGDYASAGADASYVSSSQSFLFKDEAQQFALMEMGDIYLKENTGGVLNPFILQSPPSLGASQTLRMMDAVPTSGNDGIVWAAYVGATRVAQLKHTGADAAPGFALQTNENITLSGTGKIKHGNYTDEIHASDGVVAAGSPSYAAGAWAGTSGDIVAIPIRVRVGREIKSIAVRAYKTGVGTTNHELRSITDGAVTSLKSTNHSGTGGWHTVSMASINHIVASGEKIYYRWTPSSAGEQLEGLQVVYAQG